MAHSLPSLSRSESKTRFMQRLGLDIRDPRHRQVYTMMKAEAIEGRQRIIALLNPPQSPTVPEGAIATSQIPEEIMNREIFRIHRDAHPAPRMLYDLAVNRNQPNEPNWIIRWMLWHVIRYRDRRQHNNTGDGSVEEPRSEEEDNADSTALSPEALVDMQQSVPSTLTAGSPTSQEDIAASNSRQYDPVRDEWND